MSPIIIFLFVALGIGIIIYLFYYYSGKQVIIRTLNQIPLKPAKSLKTNELSKAYGKALHVQAPLIAPCTGRKCVFYQMKIQQKISTGKSSHWKTLISEEKFQDFFIDTGEDFVIVKPSQHPRNYICHLVKDSEQKSGTFNDPTPEFKALLKRYNIDSETFFGFNKALRYEEGVIEIGEKITVAGIAKWKTLNEPTPEYPYTKIATLDSYEKQKIIITDMKEVILNKTKL